MLSLIHIFRDSVARAFSYGDGICTVISDKGAAEFSSRFEADGIEFEHPSEHLFSFNKDVYKRQRSMPTRR